MTTKETILLAAFLQLVALAAYIMTIREAWRVAAENIRKWQVALQAYSYEKAAHEATKQDLLAERREHGTEARNVDVMTI